MPAICRRHGPFIVVVSSQYDWNRANAAYGRTVAILHFPFLVPAAMIAKNRVLILVGMLSVNQKNRRERPYAGTRSRDGIIAQEPAKSAPRTPQIERDTSTSVRSIGLENDVILQ